MNAGNIMKLMNAKNVFLANHPKFISFLKTVFQRDIEEGTIIEISLTRPGEAPVTTNIKLQQSDLELFNELKNIKM